MTWTGFRPSDDPATHGYSIPSNAYAAGALQRVLALNAALWGNEQLAATAAQLLTDIEAGIQEFGVVEVTPGVEVYAYEVDGLGGVLADFDDANLPSLLAMPLLGWDGCVDNTVLTKKINNNKNTKPCLLARLLDC